MQKNKLHQLKNKVTDLGDETALLNEENLSVIRKHPKKLIIAANIFLLFVVLLLIAVIAYVKGSWDMLLPKNFQLFLFRY